MRKALLKSMILLSLGVLTITTGVASPITADSPQSIPSVFSPEHRNTLVMEYEAAVAEAQAEMGIISREAAQEIRATASLEYAPLADIAEENRIVRHRMVALLNVWRRSLSDEASAALHLGVTTVDVYDTVRILQLRQSIALMRSDLLKIENELLSLAEEHRNTPMVGRTLGQHALPITFGKKVAVWAAANRRNIERLNEVDCRLSRLGVLRGAVGTHLGLGAEGRAIEEQVAERLGLGPVEPADWHGMRDVFGEYAVTLAIMSRIYAGIGHEVFSLQMTDIAELYEARPQTAVSSSSMPHKRNPSRSEALIHHGRMIPALSDVLLDDIVNVFERDNTSRPNRVLEEITVTAGEMLDDVTLLLGRLVIDEERMLENLHMTDGMILAQRLVLHLQKYMPKEEAEERVALAAQRASTSGESFEATVLADPELGQYLREHLEELLDPTTYLGLSAAQVDETISMLMDNPPSMTCPA